ncbi:unnamed protein product [Ilex paraguariensis]|uniref:RNase H type-1 domain-containing protein n=1 Tax=Ilex paraguariensis TaxID=185542 RepID=A0ABC8SGY2_9AQUA
MILGIAAIPWRLLGYMDQIFGILGRLHFQIRHVYREANKIANFLANYAVLSRSDSDFSANGVLPLAGRLFLKQDQNMIPTTRLKKVWGLRLPGSSLCLWDLYGPGFLMSLPGLSLFTALSPDLGSLVLRWVLLDQPSFGLVGSNALSSGHCSYRWVSATFWNLTIGSSQQYYCSPSAGALLFCSWSVS